MKIEYLTIKDRWLTLALLAPHDIDFKDPWKSNLMHNLRIKLFFTTEELDKYGILMRDNKLTWKNECIIPIPFTQVEIDLLSELMEALGELEMRYIPDYFTTIFE